MGEEPAGAKEEPRAIEEAGLFGQIIDKLAIVFAVGIIAGMFILIQEVILRYVFTAPTTWAHETTIFLSAIAFVFGGLYCAAQDRHIRVVLVYDQLPPQVRRVFDITISLICAAASAIFAWAAWQMVGRAAFTPDGAFRLERSGSAWDPVYPGLTKIFLLIVLTAMVVQFLILAWSYYKKGRN